MAARGAPPDAALTVHAGGTASVREVRRVPRVVRALLLGIRMLVPLRDALSPFPERPPRWLALAVGVITAIVVAAAATVLFEREAARTARAGKARYWADAYALRGYPAWVAANPDRACPARLAELDAYVGRSDTTDPWGTTYQFMCGRQHGVVGLRVRSAGPDRQFDTRDDIGSR